MSDTLGLKELHVENGEGQQEEIEGQYTEEADIFRSEDVKKALVEYLTKEITDVLDGEERKELEEKWNTWRRHREVAPASKTKDTPWPGASNLVTPVTGSNTNGVYGRVKNIIKKRRPLIRVEGIGVKDADNAAALARFMNRLLESPLHMNFMNELNRILYETVSMGTQFVEIPWSTKRWRFKRTDENGNAVEVDRLVYDGPVVKTPRLEDFVTRVQWGNIQDAPWVAIRERMFRHELEHQQSVGFFKDVEQVVGSPVREDDENEVREQERVGIAPNLAATEEYDVFRVYVFWDTDGDGQQEDVIVWFHLDTGTILRAEFNELGRRPIVKFPYLNFPALRKPLYAMGIGWMSEMQQEEVDTFRNMRVNSTHISSIQMAVVRTGSGLGTKFRIAPALVQEMDSPKEDVQILTFPDVTASTVRGEMIARQDLERFIGAGDAAMGMSDTIAKSRATASGSMFLAQRSDSILASIIEDIESAIGEVGLYVVMQLVSNKERVKAYLLGLAEPADQALIQEVLSMNVEDIPLRFRFQVQVTREEQSEDAKRQGIMMLTQLYGLYFKEIMQILPMMGQPNLPPQVQEFLTKFFVGRTALMEETLKMFGQENLTNFVPYTKDLEFLLNMIDTVKEAQLGALYEQQRTNAAMGGGGPLGLVPPGGMGAPVPQGGEPGIGGGLMGQGEVPPGGGAYPGGTEGSFGETGQGGF